MGDAESKLENQVISSGQDVSARVLKIGHHGSKYSSTITFLRRVNPVIAVVSCGYNN